MSSVFGFVDVGFLRAGGAAALRVKRQSVRPDADGCVEWLRGFSGFLRSYWYDGAFDPRDGRYQSQRRYLDRIAGTPGIQLRLGHVQVVRPSWHYVLRRALEKCGVDEKEFARHFQLRPELRQKGVDTRLALDLVRLAQRQAYDTAVLIAGDRDLAEPVRLAQDEGRRVILAAPVGAGVAAELRQLADEVISLDVPALRGMLGIRSPDKKR